VDLYEADLSGADLCKAHLSVADLRRANLTGADLRKAELTGADLTGACLSGADLTGAVLSSFGVNGLPSLIPAAKLIGADLTGADLSWAHLSEADLRNANLSGANLSAADLAAANFSGADLTGADLVGSYPVGANFTAADLSSCYVYGVSAWDLKLEGAKQNNLIITPDGEPEITVDNLEVAQFIYLLLKNEKIRQVIDTITSKVVLILGRFTPERKAVLDALREELRQRDYLPVLFDFDKPASKDLTATVQTLANMARFVIVDLTDPSSVPHELAMVVPGTPVAVQPVLLEGQREYAIFMDLRIRHHWVLEPYRYAAPDRLIADLGEHVIVPAEAKARELQGVCPPRV
jgi:hypothetical protein